VNEEKAKRRFFALQSLRLGGLILLAAGLVIWRRSLFGFQDPTVGRIVFVAGIVAAFVAPALLRRRWRSDEGPME
jgi:hypothetical protein